MRTDMWLKCLILAFDNISIQNRDSSIYKKSNCGKTLNSNELIKSDKSPIHCHSDCLVFTLFKFLCNLFYLTSKCIPCLQALVVLFILFYFISPFSRFTFIQHDVGEGPPHHEGLHSRVMDSSNSSPQAGG